MHDEPLLPHLRRLRREWRRDDLLGRDVAEGPGGLVDEGLGAVVANDDDIGIVRRVVPAVMRVQAIAGHELDLKLAADHTLPVRMTVERDGLERLAEEE